MPTIEPKFSSALRMADARADEIEEGGRLPVDIAEALIDSEVFRLWIPKRYGGLEATVADLLDAIERAAYHDGSTGWCVMIGGTTALNAGFLRADFAEQIYGDPRAVTGGFGMPAGNGTRVDGGIRVTGEWAWGSGSSHCTWFGGGVTIEGQRGAPFVFFDMDDIEFLDTWHVAGMKGTASTHYRTNDAFVPEGRWVDFAASPEPITDSPLYRFSFLGALALGVSAVTIGLAERAIDELIALAEKQPAGSSKSLAERPVIQSDLALAEANVRSARAFVREVVEECWEAARIEGRLTDEQKRLLRLASTSAGRRSAEAVDLCYHAGGGTSVYLTSRLQRVFRDVHVATQHGMIAPRLFEPLGRMAFGLPTSTAQF
jgi:alkylation response protein AidB-like acyl-CoA dehydrogenase